MLTLNCLGGDWPSFTFIPTVVLERLSVVSNKRIFITIIIIIVSKVNKYIRQMS